MNTHRGGSLAALARQGTLPFSYGDAPVPPARVAVNVFMAWEVGTAVQL